MRIRLILFFIIIMTIFISCSFEQGKLSEIEKWDFFELKLKGPQNGNPFKEVELKAIFRNANRERQVKGFYDGNGIYRIRFMPQDKGVWDYKTISNVRKLSDQTGKFSCVESAAENHGPVEVTDTYHFQYADGTPYYQVGTTCYTWIHQGDSLEEVTLETLSKAPFNKLRMCIFPKSYSFNKNEPAYYPFERNEQGLNDFTRFNPEFWQHLEKRIMDLQKLGIEADIILFHPYDRWGYSQMPDHVDQFYLEYAMARLSAFRNVWWSMANEFDLMESKTMDDWHRFFQIVYNNDLYNHLRSIHNCIKKYDHSLPWVTHASIQSTAFDSVEHWRQEYKKPIIFDECRYEGNVRFGWGNLTAQEMTAMFYRSLIRGSYAGHGETYKHPEDILWWSKGGLLHGESPARIQFFKKILKNAPEGGFEPCNDYAAGKFGQQYLYYFDTLAVDSWTFDLPKKRKYQVEIIDTWNMTVNTLENLYQDEFTIDLPGKKYMAVRISCAEMDFPLGSVWIKSGGLEYDENLTDIKFIDQAKIILEHSYIEDLRYTLNGEEPNLNSPQYKEPIFIDKSKKLKAIAVKDSEKSDVIEFNFIKTGIDKALNIS